MKSFFIACFAFAILDIVWLGLIVKDFNMKQLSHIGRIENGAFDLWYPPAFVVYLLMGLAVVIYVLPQVQSSNSINIFFKGALLGLIVYGVYDGTNLAILKNYPVVFAALDVAWGTFAFGAVTLITKKISDLL